MAAGEKVIPEITVGNQTYKLMDETAREHLVEVKSTTPTSEDNRLWIKEMSAAEEEANTYEVPTIDEFNDLKSAMDDIYIDSQVVTLEQGGFDSTGHKTETGKTTKIRTRHMLAAKGRNITISVSEGFAVQIIKYDSAKEFDGYTDYLQEVSVSDIDYINFSIRRVLNADIDPTVDTGLKIACIIKEYGVTVGDLKNAIEDIYIDSQIVVLEQGGFNGIGEKQGSTTKIRTQHLLATKNRDVTISVSDGFLVQIMKYDSAKEFYGYTDYLQSVSVSDADYINFSIRRAVYGTDIDPSVDTGVKIVCINKEYGVTIKDLQEEIEEINIDSQIVALEQGGFDSTGNKTESGKTKKIRTKHLLATKGKNVTVSVSDGFNVQIIKYDESKDFDEYTDYLQEVSVSNVDYINFSIRRIATNTDIDPTVDTGLVIRCFTKEEEIKTGEFTGNYYPELEQGGFNSLGEKYDTNKNKKIRTINMIHVKNGKVNVSVNPGFAAQIIYYNSNKVFIDYTDVAQEVSIEGVDYIHISIRRVNSDPIDPTVDTGLKVIGSNGLSNKEIQDFAFRNAVQITDGLTNTCAFETQIAYDKSSAIMGCVSKGGWLIYGEQGSKVLLDLFPLTQPQNVRHRVAIKSGDTILPGITFSYAEGVNVFMVGARVWRVMFGISGGWYYRDYSFDSDTFGDCHEIKCEYNSEELSVTSASRISIASDFGSDDSGSSLSYLVSNIQRTSNGRIYMCWTGVHAHPIICYSDDDMETIIPFAKFPEWGNYEASIALIDNKLSVISRGNNYIGYSSDNGETWTYSAYSGDNNRPRLYVYGEYGYWVHGGSGNRTVVNIYKGTRYDTAELIKTVQNSWGLVYPSLFINNNEMYLLYSDSQTTIETDNGAEEMNGKDAVKIAQIGTVV